MAPCSRHPGQCSGGLQLVIPSAHQRSAELSRPQDAGRFLGRPGKLPVHGRLSSHLKVAMSVSVGHQDPGYSPGLIALAVKVSLDGIEQCQVGMSGDERALS